MDSFAILCFTLLELAAVGVILRLWLRRQLPLSGRILWSVILLVPLFGLLLYGLTHSGLKPHPSQADTQTWYGGDT